MLEIAANKIDPLALTPEQAVDVFDILSGREDIAFNYVYDGCYARAHLMCRFLIQEGLRPSKAWAFEGDDGLKVKMPDGRKTRWSYHVAPTLPVRLQGGGIQDMVFDPALFDGPVSLQEWGKLMGAPEHKLHIASFGHPPPGRTGDYDTAKKTGQDRTRTRGPDGSWAAI